MNRDEAPAAASSLALAWPPPSLGWLEVALPLWRRKGWLALGALLGALAGYGLLQLQPLGFSARASFVVQPVQRPSQGAMASALPGLAGMVGGAASMIDQHVAILRSREVAERILDRFELQRAWALPYREQALVRLVRSVDITPGRREGVVYIEVDDANPHRAAALANQFVDELKAVLRGFALDEARQRRAFYDAQLARAREGLARAQRELQASGFDRAALRTEPRAAAEAYGRWQAEVAAAEIRLAATRRVRAEESAEVQQQISELTALRAQLAATAAPRDDAAEGRGGSFVGKVREFRYAEALVEAVARQADAARVDEASEPVPLQVLDRARVPSLPSRPRALSWLAAGLLFGLLVPAVWVLVRHRAALARLDPGYRQRLDLVRSVLPERRRLWPWRGRSHG